MEQSEKNWSIFYIQYLGECTYRELAKFMPNSKEEEVFNHLEKLVKREQLTSSVVNGEIIYKVKPINDYMKEITG